MNIRFKNYIKLFFSVIILFNSINTSILNAQGFRGYYQYPDIHDNTIVFTSEGDIWKVSVNGGLAQRLTTHPEEERYANISPDGKTLAYSASYEGPTEIYTMPINGGITTRWTYESETSSVTNWSPDNKIIYQTQAYNKLPDEQLVTIDLKTKIKSVVPLYQASEGTQNEKGDWIFIRPADHGDAAKRYVGGTARQIWKFDGKNEAVKLTNDYDGESHKPMWYDGRVFFISDRDGIMNIWSMDSDGNNLEQHTKHKEYDVRYANIHDGKTISFTENKGVRYRDAIFSHDGKEIITLSDESGEFEFVKLNSTGSDNQTKITKNGTTLRYQGIPSPDGKWIAYDDLESNMYILDIKTGESKKISSNNEGIRDFSWSPDSKWLAFVQTAFNSMTQIIVYNFKDESKIYLTTDRANSFSLK